MDIAAALFDYLSKSATIHAAVADRIYPVQLPQNATKPALVYREMYTDNTYLLQADDTLLRPTIEIECHADSYGSARAVMRTVKGVLQNYSGLMGDAAVQAVLVSGGAEDYNPETLTYWRSLEFEFFIEEA